MTQSVDLFIQAELTEQEVLAHLNQTISAGVESADFPQDGARIFLMHFRHGSGFRTACSLCWGDVELTLGDIALAQGVALQFATEVLLEPQHLNLPSGWEWCLVNQAGELYGANIVELEDGIEVAKQTAAPLQPT